MMYRTFKHLIACLLAGAAMWPLGAAQAQASYPGKPVRMLIALP